jgi:hypothetical protein
VQLCLKCQAQSVDCVNYCQNCGADLKEWSHSAEALKRMQENPRVDYVRLLVGADACPACQHAEGSYPKNTPPKLPIEGCSHALGCRCFYQPVLEEIYP